MTQNPDCCGKRCQYAINKSNEVRMYVRVETLRNVTKLRLCEACWTHENAHTKTPLEWSKASVYADITTPYVDMPLSYTRSDDGAKMVMRAPFVYLNQRY